MAGKCYKAEDVTEERVAEYLDFLEEARAFPGDMDPLLDIICEKAEYYFDGVKSFEEMVDVINNRVGLYIKEQNIIPPPSKLY